MSDRYFCQHLTCSTSYATEAALADHIRVGHKGARATFPFACERCAAPFQTNVGLEVHMLEAHGVVVEVPRIPEANRCTHCGRSLPTRHGLWLHSKRIHGDATQGRRAFTQKAAS